MGVGTSLSLARVEWVPRGDFERVADEPGGWTDVVFHGRRLRALEDEVEFADEAFASAIRQVARVPGGWLFLARDGVAAFSPTFTGPLQRVGDFPQRHLLFSVDDGVVQRREGRMAVVDRDRVAWSSDGGTFQRVTGLAPGPVDDIEFIDGRRGGALIAGSTLQCTRDAGRTWTTVPPGERAWEVLEMTACAFGGEGTDAGGSAGAREREPAEPFAAEVLSFDALRLAAVRHDPLWLDALGSKSSDPTTAWFVWRQTLLTFELSTGREIAAASCRDLDAGTCWQRDEASGPSEDELAILRAARPGLEIVDASRTPWGLLTARLAVGDAAPSVFVVRSSGTTVSGDIPAGTEHVAFADARRGLAWSSPPYRLVRTLDGGAHWEEVPLAIDGDVAAALPAPRDDRPSFDGESNRRRPSRDDPWHAIPGTCTAARCMVGSRLFVRGWGPLDPSPRRALAARLQPPPVDAGVARANDASVPDENVGVIASRPTSRELLARVEGVGARVPRFRCETVGRPSALPPLRPVVPAGVRAATFATRTVDGEARGAIWREPGRAAGPGRRASFAWRAVTPEDIVVGSVSNVWVDYFVTADFRRPLPARPRGPHEPTFLAPLSMGRGHLTFSLSERPAPMVDGRAFRVTTGATRATTARAPVPMFFPNFRPWLQGDGIFVLGSPGGSDMDQVFVLDLPAGGAVARVRSGHFREGGLDEESYAGPTAIARRGEHAGGAVLVPEGWWSFLPVRPTTAANPVEVRWNPDAVVTVCAGPPDPDAFQLTLPDRLTTWPARVEHDGGAEEHATLEVTPTATCVRAMDVVTEGETLRVVAREDGSLGGIAVGERARREVRCVVR